MSTKLYLTIAAIVAILYALAFLLIPVQASLLFSDFADHALFYICVFAARQCWRGA